MENKLPWSYHESLGYDGLPVNEEIAIEIINEVGVNATNDLGDTPLSVASELGSVKIVKWLLRNGAEVDYVVKESGGETPLLRACEQKRYDVIKILLENNANIEAVNRFGNTPLANTFINCFDSPLHIARFLILKGAKITERVLELGDEWNKELFRNLLMELNKNI